MSIVKMLDGPLYNKTLQTMARFISELEPMIRLKSYLIFLEKAVEDKNVEEAEKLF